MQLKVSEQAHKDFMYITSQNAQKFEDAMQAVRKAHDELLRRLFGEVPEDVGSKTVSREKYTEVMKEIQKEYGLLEGNPDLMLFIFEQLSRSPKFEEDAL